MLLITQEGDYKDYVLSPGQEFVVTRRGLVLAQAIGNALVRVRS